MTTGERLAREYCEWIGSDPDELVFGTLEGHRGWCKLARWRWYVGVHMLQDWIKAREAKSTILEAAREQPRVLSLVTKETPK